MQGMGFRLKIVLLFLLSSISKATFDYPCSALYPFYSTMTPYSNVHGDGPTKFDDCEARSIWMLVSHGAHYPSVEDIIQFNDMGCVRDQILENHNKYFSGELCIEEIKSFSTWEFRVNLNQTMSLTQSGHEELTDIGKRLKENFPDLLNDNSNITVRITSDGLSRMSASALIGNLTDPNLKYFNESILVVDDELLMNEKNCSAWNNSTRSQKLTNEVNSFMESKPLLDILASVKNRLGFLQTGSFEFIERMYNLCGYENSWYPSDKSPWCSVFTVKSAMTLEYLRDLTYYYESGYGNSLTKKLGCKLLDDLLKRLTEDVQLTFNFGDSLAMRKLLLAMDIASGDIPLEGNGYYNATQRQWRTSFLTPFSGNVMVILFKCPSGSYGINETFRVASFLNENLIKFPACSNQEMCGLSEFKNIFHETCEPKNCNRDFCEVKV